MRVKSLPLLPLVVVDGLLLVQLADEVLGVLGVLSLTWRLGMDVENKKGKDAFLTSVILHDCHMKQNKILMQCIFNAMQLYYQLKSKVRLEQVSLPLITREKVLLYNFPAHVILLDNSSYTSANVQVLTSAN